MQEYKVLITTSGIGSRLGELTKYTNKSLIKVGKKPAISYVVESYKEDIELVVTIGHYKEHVKEFLQLAYPNRKFSFIEVDNYDKEGSSLIYSILQAKEYLQCPFIFHACDTIVLDSIEEPKENCLYVSKKENNLRYRTVNVLDSYVCSINEKNIQEYDYVYIGLAAVNNYIDFWKELDVVYNNDKLNSQLSDCHVISNLLNYDKFKYIECKKWYDIGNLEELTYSRNNIYDRFDILDKLEESIFLFDDFVIKFFYNKDIVKNRVQRASILNDTVPKILDSKENFYKYEFVKGDLLSEVVNENIFEDFLNWSLKNLWKKQECDNFKDLCYDFYVKKTNKRIDKLLKENNLIDCEQIINGIKIPTVKSILNDIDIEYLCDGCSCIMHGDYILDNILKTEQSFKLLDWRQDFGGNIYVGDIYYDLAKLNHNLSFNHEIVNKGLYKVEDNENIIIDILTSFNLNNCKKILMQFCDENGFDYNKVNMISSIIWLNMAPLHIYPLNMFLFYFGKYNLYNQLR